MKQMVKVFIPLIKYLSLNKPVNSLQIKDKGMNEGNTDLVLKTNPPFLYFSIFGSELT